MIFFEINFYDSNLAKRNFLISSIKDKESLNIEERHYHKGIDLSHW